MVAIAQLVEPRIVIPVVVGSSPISHPIFFIIHVFKHSHRKGVFLCPKFRFGSLANRVFRPLSRYKKEWSK